MAPKFKFTKEEITKAAANLVRESGEAALTARGLAEKLGTSAKPIFGLFTGMAEVRATVIGYAAELYREYIIKTAESGKYPLYKSSGMAYILFAKEERELFKLLFMRDRSEEKISDEKAALRPILNEIMKNTGLSEDEAYLFHLEMWIFVHGIATMTAGSYLEWDIDFASKAISDVYEGLKTKFGETKK